jgi:hypothetical protein
MQLINPHFKMGETIPAKYTCDGENINPSFTIKDVPEGTHSLVLIADDPDAPPGDWVHWVLWNLGADLAEIKEGEIPEGAIEGMTDFGRRGYGGPCPPSGEHRYFFKLYALDKVLDLDHNATKQDVLEAMEGHIIEQAQVIGVYARS